ncbi:MAG: DJ-1/PfpI family protein [Actinobacteria bacterium]|nr:DJ-1/PfpI family protein [Actinomycetota bacterium]
MTRLTRTAFILMLAALLSLIPVSCGEGKGVTVMTEGGGPPSETAPVEESGGAQAGNSVLLVVAQEDFQDIEYDTVRKALAGAGFGVTVAAPEKEPAVGVSGTMVTPDLSLAEARASAYAAVIFIGGPGTPSLFDSRDAHRLAVEAAQEGKVLAAICLAPAILARAGVLRGRRATVYPSAAGELTAGGAQYTGAGVEIDGNLVTADGPEASEQFAQAVIQKLR